MTSENTANKSRAPLRDKVISNTSAKTAIRSGITRAIDAVALIQRFDLALNLNIHFHIVCLDSVCEVTPGGAGCQVHNGGAN